MSNDLVPASPATLSALVTAADDRARIRLLESFASMLRNSQTMRAYSRAFADRQAQHIKYDI